MSILDVIETYGFELNITMTIGVLDEAVNTLTVYSNGNFDIDIYGDGEHYMCWIGEQCVDLEILIEALNNME